jgi:hypothetical protein
MTRKMAAFGRNGWQVSPGISGRFEPEWVAGLGRNMQNRLGHENIQSTTVYTHMDLAHKRTVQNKFIEYMKSNLSEDPKISEWIDWENKKDILEWLDSL